MTLFEGRRKINMKLAIVVNSDFAAAVASKYLISDILAHGIDLVLMMPDGPYAPKLVETGARHLVVPFRRFPAPLRDLKICLQLYRAFRSEKPDIVHTMSAKPNTFGALAAWLAGVPRIVALTRGLGRGFSKGGGWKGAVLRFVVSRLYRLAGKVIDRMWFLNGDDLAVFVERGLVGREQAVLIRSEGIDLQEYSPDNVPPRALTSLRKELEIDEATQVVLMAGRVIWSKGVREFVEASRLAAKWRRRVMFVLVGFHDPDGPDSVPEKYLQNTSHFTWLGFRPDLVELLALSDVVTLPSFYREGFPGILMQAMAMKKPIVTTDNVGCRDTVDHGKNGFLVPIRDTRAFASAVETLVNSAQLRATFGTHSFAKARNEFAVEVVNRRVFEDLYGLDYENHGNLGNEREDKCRNLRSPCSTKAQDTP